MDPRTRRWLVPLAAAVAVLTVLAVMWTQRPGASGGDEPGFAGAAPASPSDSPTSAPGSGVPGSPGTGGLPGDEPGGGLTPGPGPDRPPGPGRQAIESYYPRDDTTLAMNYTSGVPECYGRVGEPLVEETADAVTVTLPKSMPKQGSDIACIDIALSASVDVTLSRPLGDRDVLDGSRDRAKVERADAAYGDAEGPGEPAY